MVQYSLCYGRPKTSGTTESVYICTDVIGGLKLVVQYSLCQSVLWEA